MKVKTALEMSNIANIIINKQQISSFGSVFLFSSFSAPLVYSPLNNNFLLQLEHHSTAGQVFPFGCIGCTFYGTELPFLSIKGCRLGCDAVCSGSYMSA